MEKRFVYDAAKGWLFDGEIMEEVPCIVVQYQSGESREMNSQGGFDGIDYMLGEYEDIELYQEATPVEDDETGTYEELKAAIIEKAEEYGIPREWLEFYLDFPT